MSHNLSITRVIDAPPTPWTIQPEEIGFYPGWKQCIDQLEAFVTKP